MKTQLLLLIFFVSLFASCGSKEITLKGEAYVLTKSSATAKVPLVKVKIVSAEVVKEYLPERKQAYSKLKADEKQAYDRYQAAMKEDEKNTSDSSNKFGVRFNSAELARKTYDEAALKTQGRALIDFVGSGLIPVDAAVTDSEGKFSVKVPKPGKYLVYAQGQRQVFDSTEDYGWAFWMDAKDSQQLISLNSDNMLFQYGGEQFPLN